MLDQKLYDDNRNQPYYTEANGIAALMAELLGDVTNKAILEPAVGRGAFLGHLIGQPSLVDGVDVDGDALSITKRDFGRITKTIHRDFIELCLAGMFSQNILRNDYDAVISNPPYGLRFSQELRKSLKARLGNFYVRESYGLFIKFSLERLRRGGRYVFIIPDTFLNSNNHSPLREFLSGEFCPTQIVLFDSKLFGSVQFGYGNLCIIAGNRGPQPAQTAWCDLRRTDRTALDLKALAWEIQDSSELQTSFAQGWVPPSLKSAPLGESMQLLGEIAECRTGIYSGDNVQALGFDPTRLQRRANGHAIDWKTDVRTEPLSSGQKQNGVAEGPAYVPLIRGGHREPFEDTFWAIRWDEESIRRYKSDKKARFQNSGFYFREGIAVPMVTSGRLSASYMAGAVFDQGVVGIFPKDVNVLSFLLLYLNSSFVTKVLKETINPSANNSAKYIARIPVPKITSEIIALGKENETILHQADKQVRLMKIDALISRVVTTENI